MKKSVAAVAVLLSLFSLASCGNAAPSIVGKYTYDYQGAFGAEKAQFNFVDATTCEFNLPDNQMITDVYAGTYTFVAGDKDNLKLVTVTGLTNKNTASSYTKPGLWSWIDSSTGNCQVTVDTSALTFTPVTAA
jgi:hypothetical protein